MEKMIPRVYRTTLSLLGLAAFLVCFKDVGTAAAACTGAQQAVTVNFVPAGSGTVSPASGSCVSKNSSTTFTVTHTAGYAFDTSGVAVSPAGYQSLTTSQSGDNGTFSFNPNNADRSVTVNMKTASYTVTTTASPAAGGTLSPSNPTVNYGNTKDITLTPTAAYNVSSASGCGGTLAGNVFTTGAITGPCTVTGNFALKTFVVTTSVSAGNGTIQASPTVTYGSNVTVTATPTAGHTVLSWWLDGVQQAGTGSTFTLTNVTAAHTLQVQFRPLNSYVVTLTQSTGGTIGFAAGSASVTLEGGSCTMSIAPDSCYTLSNIKDNGYSAGAVNPYTITGIGQDHTVQPTFSTKSLVVTGSAGTGGTIAPASAAVTCGGTTTFNVSANAGYNISSVSGCGGTWTGTNPYTTGAVTANCTVSATFSVGQYTISTSAGAGGTVTVNPSATVNYGTDATVKIEAANGYGVVDVVVDSVSKGAITTYTFTGVRANHTVSATFAPVYTISASTDGNGTISPSGSVSVLSGGSKGFTITPSKHYNISSVLVDGVNAGTGSSYTFTNVTANHTIYVSFSRSTTYTISSSVGSGGTISPLGNTSVTEGNNQSYTITANAGYNIADVKVDGVSVGAVGSWTFSGVAADHTISATFASQSGLYTITVTQNAGGTIAPGTVTVTENSDQSFTITPNSGFSISGVLVDGVNQGAVNGWTFDSVSTDHTLAVTFAAVPTYTITVTNGANGSISANGVTNPASVTLYQGGNQSFTITPTAGYAVLDVKVGPAAGPLTSVLSQLVFNNGSYGYTFANVHANMAITVTYAQAYVITASAGLHGIISPSGSVPILSGASQIFAIVPNPGYEVSSVLVDGASVGAVTTYPFNAVSANHTISATFVQGGGDLTQYCDIPPYLSSPPKPNVLLMLDNSSSMYDLAYTTPLSYCYDPKYDNGKTYAGYFTAPFYSFDTATGKFSTAASLTAATSCTFGQGSAFVCVNMTGTAPNRTVQSFTASGNFLNWLTMSKLDMEKLNLTGGKYSSQNGGMLIGESRGCQGDRFAKQYVNPATGSIDDVTFAVRGPNASDLNNINPTAAGGPTTIEIYDGNYSDANASCSAAMVDWQNCLDVTDDLWNCSGWYNSEITGKGQQHQVAASIIAACASLRNDQTPNIGQIQLHCSNMYRQNGFPPTWITSPYSALGACGTGFSHALFENNPYGPANVTGYMANCFTDDGSAHGVWDQAPRGYTNCSLAELWDYCQAAQLGTVTDPSYAVQQVPPTAAAPGSQCTSGTQNAFLNPAYFVYAGIDAMNLAGSFPVNVGVSSPPTGVIDTFKDKLNFGLMTFQLDGSASEAGATPPALSIPYICQSTSNPTLTCLKGVGTNCPAGPSDCVAQPHPTDGGVVKQIITSHPGDHGTGLIGAIDNVTATSWTPWAEAFFNAMGYFAPVMTCGGVSGGTPCTSPASCPGSVCLPVGRLTCGGTTTGTACSSDSDCTGTGDQCLVVGQSLTALTLGGTNYQSDNFSASGSTAAYSATPGPVKFSCQGNYILIISDGMSTADRNTRVADLVTAAHQAITDMPSSQTGSATVNGQQVPPFNGSRNLDDLAWLANNMNITSLSTPWTANSFNSQHIITYVVYTGEPCDAAGTGISKNSDGICNTTDESKPEYLMQLTATKGGGKYFASPDPMQLQQKLQEALNNISAATNSGTAASILSNSAGSGAVLLQAIFYPSKTFDKGATNANWLGEMHNLWYYVDPLFTATASGVSNGSSLRENSSDSSSQRRFNLMSDYELRFDDPGNVQAVSRYVDSDGNGSGDVLHGQITPDEIHSLWRAGLSLWALSSSDSRNIYTPTKGAAGPVAPLIPFDDSFPAASNGLLQASTALEASNIVSFIRGTDIPNVYRSRTITALTKNASGNYVSSAPLTGVWRLGDIISSTPRVQSSVRLNSYNMPSPASYGDVSYASYLRTPEYQRRGLVYVGANDGMLHAFKLGNLSVTNLDTAAGGSDLKATLGAYPGLPNSGDNLGGEQWAFIPYNVLPYLKYTADRNYSHIFTADGPTIISDVSTGDLASGGCPTCVKDTVNGSNWRTILLGSMGIGGATRNSTVVGTGDFIKTPIDGVGFSSYYALDVTDQSADANGVFPAPKFLWEFTDPDLGATTSGPAIVRVKATAGRGDDGLNGKWFAVFASGPTGPIDQNVCAFKGKTDKNLFIYVVDLATGHLLKKFDTEIPNAFAGSITNGVLDTDRWNKASNGFYEDDVIYIPYTQQNGDNSWTGGVLRLVTKEDQDPRNWAWSRVISGLGGPVTVNVGKLQDRKNHQLWLYFGTGRYYYSADDTSSTAPAASVDRRLYGVTDPCYTSSDTYDSTCEASATVGTLQAQNDTLIPTLTLCTGTLLGVNTPPGCKRGWYIDLDGEDTNQMNWSERVVTDPIAMTNGAVFFMTYKPSAQPCSFGGSSLMWAVKYDSGTTPPQAAMQGKAMVQVSTGTFNQIDLSTAFTTRANRRTATPLIGKPPSDPPPLVSRGNLKPVKRVLHIEEH